jgi:hypothetical protein
MTGSLYSIVCREAGAGGGVRRGRTKGPGRRPPFVAHVAAFWSPDTAAVHLASCRSADGVWRPWAELNEEERWSA